MSLTHTPTRTKISSYYNILIITTLTILLIASLSTAYAEPRHGISIFGDLKYKEEFRNFDYVNPNAPKGGTVKLASIGSFDSLNPFILKGVAADGIDMIFDTLLTKAADEESSEYGLLAESVSVAPDHSSVTFVLRKSAKWFDGTEITADDVVFSFYTIKEKGHPQYLSYYRDIKDAIKLSKYEVKFTFADNKNRELPVIIGQLPIISKKYYTENEFDKTTLTSPLGSGPYYVKEVNPGRSITFQRNANYWAKDLNVNKGRYNFDTIKIDYYRDEVVAIEALKAGEYDFRRENISKTWKTAYNIDQVKNDLMVKEELPDGTPTGMQCFVFNIRRDKFSDPLVRQALNYAYDFEWANKQLFFGAYTRNTSFFDNSDYASSGLPDSAELKLLEPIKDEVPPRLFTEKFSVPTTDGSGNARPNLIIAQQLLEEAGWHLKDMKRINPKTGEIFTIEFLLTSPSFERIVAPYVRNLNKLGIQSTIRTVDSSQYIKMREEFDYDIMVNWFLQGTNPGNEQINYWHSSKADINGSMNYIGIKNKAVDYLVEKLVNASSKEELVTSTRALDRVLLWNYYVVPQWNSRTHRIIYWNKFSRPEITPPYALSFLDTWWIDKDKLQSLETTQGKNNENR